MAEVVAPSKIVVSSSKSSSRVLKVTAEEPSTDSKDSTSIKVICLGDSAVGKSK